MTLEEILKGVSRSFYLSLRFLPRRVRTSMSLAFLVCKAADTITDTRLIPREQRLAMLADYRQLFTESPDTTYFERLKKDVAVAADNIHEKQLLLQLPDLFSALNELTAHDQEHIASLATELTHGMIFDLTRFSGEDASEMQFLYTDKELDDYTYYVAGCVGLFWTRILREHFKFARGWDRELMKEIGINFGKGLQMVNILRDLPRDLQQGRCYLPSEALQQRSLAPHHLLDSASLELVKPYLQQLLKRTRDYLACGRQYAGAHPLHTLRLKWVVLLPMKLGFQTLDLLEKSDSWLDPDVVLKVSRPQVYRTMLTAFLSSFRRKGIARPLTAPPYAT